MIPTDSAGVPLYVLTTGQVDNDLSYVEMAPSDLTLSHLDLY